MDQEGRRRHRYDYGQDPRMEQAGRSNDQRSGLWPAAGFRPDGSELMKVVTSALKVVTSEGLLVTSHRLMVTSSARLTTNGEPSGGVPIFTNW